MNFNSRWISEGILSAFLAVAPLGLAWADPAAKATESPTKTAQTTKATGTKATGQSAATRKPLDLRAPALDRVFSRTDIETLTSRPDDVSEGAETVAVEGARHDSVIAPSGLRGLAWGVRHPTQAWRLFVPSPSE